jgi:hypothetical protein
MRPRLRQCRTVRNCVAQQHPERGEPDRRPDTDSSDDNTHDRGKGLFRAPWNLKSGMHGRERSRQVVGARHRESRTPDPRHKSEQRPPRDAAPAPKPTTGTAHAQPEARTTSTNEATVRPTPSTQHRERDKRDNGVKPAPRAPRRSRSREKWSGRDRVPPPQRRDGRMTREGEEQQLKDGVRRDRSRRPHGHSGPGRYRPTDHDQY